jgi:hypothetical protein
MEEAAFSKVKALFTSKLDVNLKKEQIKCCIWRIVFMALKIENSVSGSEMPQKFLNMLLEMDGKEHLDPSLQK